MEKQLQELEEHAKSLGMSLPDWIRQTRRELAILSQATEFFGSQDRAREWMIKPARGLDRRAPVELVASAEGSKQVADLLTRLEHGVYW